MKQHQSNYLNNRVLRQSVGYLLNAGAGASKDATIDLPRVMVADDLMLEFVQGPVRFSRTKEGVLVQADLSVGITGDCFRCLEPVDRAVQVQLEELYATQPDADAEFRLHEDGILDLAPLLRAEVLITTSRGVRCEETDACDERMRALAGDDGALDIDPRLAKLQELLDADNTQ